MESATALPADGTQQKDPETHFAIELLGLIARIIATALAINIVFAGIVLLFAGQAAAASTDTSSSHRPVAAQEIQPGRTDPSARAISGNASARDLQLVTVHRLTTRPILQFNAIAQES